jgi:hypothetical protein
MQPLRVMQATSRDDFEEQLALAKSLDMDQVRPDRIGQFFYRCVTD